MSSTSTVSRTGSTQAVVPEPPFQPQRPGAIHGSAASTSTAAPSVQEAPGPTIGSACSRWAAVSAGVVSSGGAPPSAIAPKKRRTSPAVETRPAFRRGNARPGSNPVDAIPSGSETRSANSSGSGRPVARSSSTPRIVSPVSYSQPSPGWNASGRPQSAATKPSAVISADGPGGLTPRSRIAACSGVGSKTAPQPEVKSSSIRTVTGRRAGTVSSSAAPGATSTCGSAASGSQRSIGSSSDRTPSCARPRVSAAPIGLVTEASRKRASSRDVSPPVCSSTRPPMRTAPA